MHPRSELTPERLRGLVVEVLLVLAILIIAPSGLGLYARPARSSVG
jgi:hypothetical protein